MGGFSLINYRAVGEDSRAHSHAIRFAKRFYGWEIHRVSTAFITA